MAKGNPIIQFLVITLLSLCLVFFLHSSILRSNGFPPYGNQLALSYLVNGMLAISIFVSIYIFRRRLKNQIGFLFMGGSFLKFIFFFIFFYPEFKADGEMSRLEFAAFFVPYGISLIIETIFTAQLLKKRID